MTDVQREREIDMHQKHIFLFATENAEICLVRCLQLKACSCLIEAKVADVTLGVIQRTNRQ